MDKQIDYIDEYELRFLKQVTLGIFKIDKHKKLKLKFSQFKNAILAKEIIRKTEDNFDRNVLNRIRKHLKSENKKSSAENAEYVQHNAFMLEMETYKDKFLTLYNKNLNFISFLKKTLSLEFELPYEDNDTKAPDYLAWKAWEKYIQRPKHLKLWKLNPASALWIEDLSNYYADYLFEKKDADNRFFARSAFHLKIIFENISMVKVAHFLEDYMKKHLRFNNAKSRIYYGSKYCFLGNNTNEYYVAKVLFNNLDKNNNKVLYCDAVCANVEQMKKNLLSHRAVEYASRRINKKFKQTFDHVNDLISMQDNCFQINEDIIKT